MGRIVTLVVACGLVLAPPAMAQKADDADALNALVVELYDEGKYAEAIPIAKRVLTIREKALGLEHPEVAAALNSLAKLYHSQGRYAEAESLYKRSLSIREKALGLEHRDVAATLNNLGSVYRYQGKYEDAIKAYSRALTIREKALGPTHSDVAATLLNLGNVYVNQGKYEDAIKAYSRALAIDEAAHGPDHPDVATDLNSFGIVYRHQGKYGEAIKAYSRVLAIREKALGPEHPLVAATLNNLGLVYSQQGQYPEALKAYSRALAIKEKALGPGHPNVATTLNNLGIVYRHQGKYGEAIKAYSRVLAIREKALGPEHPLVAATLSNLGLVYWNQGKYEDALRAYDQALAIDEEALGPEHPDVAETLNNLGMLFVTRRDWGRAEDYWQRATAIIEHRISLGAAAALRGIVSKERSEAVRNSGYFQGLVKAAYRRAASDQAEHAHEAQAMFVKAQWAVASKAAAALAKMAARGAKGDTKLAALVRERQDLVVEWQRRDEARTAAVSQPPQKRNMQTEAANVARLLTIEAQVADIDKQLKKEFPDYAALVSPKPLSIGDVQSQLRSGEALVLFLDTPEWKPTPEETFIWAVTKTDSRWVRSDLGTPSLKREVAALRCGLDYDGSWGAPGSTCRELLKTIYSQADRESGKPLPFDINRSHELYKALFGQIEDLIKDKQLLIVPSGALTQLPFQVLVTEKPDPAPSELDALRNAAWLNRSHALTVLPSVSSLRALRQLAKDSHASRPFIGFGDPLLDGRPDRYPEDAALALRARANQSCPKELSQQVANLRGVERGVRPLALRGGMADVAEIRSQVPLPETANELCAVARDLGVSGDDIRLGAHATETEIKRWSQSGELAKYRMVHFATHGALAGQVSGNSESGLLLTPPVNATETDDGYLSASEIAGLKLDSDWVILSACNTAAGGADGAEALSGLARAFFYAGARALLVSHWSVYSDATVKLITGAISKMTADRRVGRAEAMRQSMLALIDNGKPYEAHPAFWAPFVVVGEGAAPSH